MGNLNSKYRLISTPTGLEDSWLISYEKILDQLTINIECWNAKVANLVFHNSVAVSDYGTLYPMYLGESLERTDTAHLFPYKINNQSDSKKVFSIIDADDIGTLNVMSTDCEVATREPFSDELISIHVTEALDLHTKPVTISEYTPLMNCSFHSYIYHSIDQTLTLNVLDQSQKLVSLHFFCLHWFFEYNISDMSKFSDQIVNSNLICRFLKDFYEIPRQEHDLKHFQFLRSDGQPCADIICRAVTIGKKKNGQ